MEKQTVSEQRILTRRNMLRASAWAVPAITLANAAPAMAASGVTDKPGSVPTQPQVQPLPPQTTLGALQFSSPQVARTNGPKLQVLSGFFVQAASGVDPATNTYGPITLTAVIPDEIADGSVGSVPSPWSVLAPQHSGNTWIYTFVWESMIDKLWSHVQYSTLDIPSATAHAGGRDKTYQVTLMASAAQFTTAQTVVQVGNWF